MHKGKISKCTNAKMPKCINKCKNKQMQNVNI